MRPIISMVGKSESGKTTLLESLIVELKQRGYKVAIIKHAREDIELDKQGKDTWRFSQSGCDVVAISSGRTLALMRKLERDFSPQALSRFIAWDYDLILTEGFKQSGTRKIEVHRKEQGEGLLSPAKQLLAVVTDEPLDVNVPQFSMEEVQGLADLIENKLLAQRRKDEVDLLVNEAHIPLNLFVKSFVAKTVLGMVSTLKGIKEVKSLQISLRRKP
ncbi:molybdopterin-guanine dinucleotide biosynthesis protein B [Chloroflexota bacterium]